MPLPGSELQAQERETDSPLSLVRRLARLRRDRHSNDATVRVHPQDNAVMIIESLELVVAHNLSRVTKPAPSTGAPVFARGLSDGKLLPYGFV